MPKNFVTDQKGRVRREAYAGFCLVFGLSFISVSSFLLYFGTVYHILSALSRNFLMFLKNDGYFLRQATDARYADGDIPLSRRKDWLNA